MPAYESVATARLYLLDKDGNTVMRNFVCYDVAGGDKGSVLPLADAVLEGDGGLCQNGEKLNSLKGGSVSFRIGKEKLAGRSGILRFEASARETFSRDASAHHPDPGDVSYMLGYKVDRGANPNCFFQTTKGAEYPSVLRVTANGKEILSVTLADDPADSRGCLSWHYQKEDRKLDEAGTYGYLLKAEIPEEIMNAPAVTLRFESDNGFSLYGRKSGRYPTAVEIL